MGFLVAVMYRMSHSQPLSSLKTVVADRTTRNEEIRWGLGQAVNPANLASFLTVSGIRSWRDVATGY